MADVQRFGSRGVLGLSELRQYPVIAAGQLPGGEEVAYAFESDNEFLDWISETPFGSAFQSAEERLERLRASESGEYGNLGRRAVESVEHTARQLTDLAAKSRLDPNSTDLHLLAAQVIPSVRNPIDDPTILNETPNFGGPGITFWDQYIPDLKIVGWSNRARSARVIMGASTLCTELAWGGRRFRMFALIYAQFNLEEFGFGANTQSFFPAYMT